MKIQCFSVHPPPDKRSTKEKSQFLIFFSLLYFFTRVFYCYYYYFFLFFGISDRLVRVTVDNAPRLYTPCRPDRTMLMAPFVIFFRVVGYTALRRGELFFKGPSGALVTDSRCRG